jgi:hypothetical protein
MMRLESITSLALSGKRYLSMFPWPPVNRSCHWSSTVGDTLSRDTMNTASQIRDSLC